MITKLILAMNSKPVAIHSCGLLDVIKKDLEIDTTKEGCVKGKNELSIGIKDYTVCVCRTDLCNYNEECSGAKNLQGLNIKKWFYFLAIFYLFYI